MNEKRCWGTRGTAEVERRFRPRAVALFALGLLSLVLAFSFFTSTAQADPIEVDAFPRSGAEVSISTQFGSETVRLSGPTTVEVDLGSLADSDGDGREEIDTEIVSMQLTGTSNLLGPVTVRVPQARHPLQRSVGKIEESINVQPGRLDLPGRDPPFCVEPVPPNCVGTMADSFFDVYFEVEAAGQVLHNHDPKHMMEIIVHKPPATGETYENPDVIQLFNESEIYAQVDVTGASHTPDPHPVGGVAELPEAAQAPAGQSDSSDPPYAVFAGAAAAAIVTLTAGAWYARRRWLR